MNNYITPTKLRNDDSTFDKQDVLSVSGEYGVVNQIEFQGRSFAGESVAPYKVVNTGDVVYTKSPLKKNPYGIIKTNKGPAGIVSTLYAVYGPNENVNSKFVQTYFESDNRLNRYLAPLVNKGAKNDMKVNDENALLGNVTFPEVDEQNRIVNFFNDLDNLIAANQRKVDALKTEKVAYLERIFNQKLRFAGFTEPWVQRKVTDLAATTFGGGTPKTSTVEFWEGDLPWIQSSDLVQDDVLNEYSTKLISNEAIKNSAAKRIPEGSIAVVTRVGVGKLALVNTEYATSQDFLSLSDLTGDTKFTLYLLYRLLKNEAANAQGTSIKGITKADLVNKVISLPTNEDEQHNVGELFESLDRLIAANQKKIELLQNQKAAYLQKMFI